MTIAIATPVLSDAATIGTVGNELGTLPASNLLTPALSEVWRTSGLASIYVTLDLGAAQAINLVALLGTNASSAATWRVRAATSEANLTAAPGYDSGSVTHWPQTNLGDWSATHAILWLTSAQSYQWWRVDVTDSGNSAGYYQAGRLYIANAWQPSVPQDWEAQHAWHNDSRRTRVVGGQIWTDERPSWRVWEGQLSWLTRAEALETVAPLQRLRAGKRDILLIEDPTAAELQELSIYGQIRAAEAISRRRTGDWGVKVSVEELL